MLVEMRTNYASPRFGTCNSGKKIDLPDDIARDLIAGGYASYAGAEPMETAATSTPEAAMKPSAKPGRIKRKRRGARES